MSQNQASGALVLLRSNKVVQILSYSMVAFIAFLIINVFPLVNGLLRYYISGAFVSIVILVLTHFLLKAEGSSLTALGLHWRHNILRDSIIGLIVGVGVMVIIYALLLLMSNVSYLPLANTSVGSFLIHSISILLLLAFMEEVVFRGYLLFKLREIVGTRFAIYLTAIVFGLYHGLVIESLTGPAVWGLLFALMAFWSKGLALPILFHFALNWMQSLFDLKPKYTPGLFEFVLLENSSNIPVNQLGLVIQGVVLIIAIVLIEFYCRKQHQFNNYTVRPN